jgi:DNA processing protein
VFAVPGDVGRETSRGCNLLIRDGATPVLDPGDLVASLSLLLGPARVTPAASPVGAADAPSRALLASVPPGGVTLESAAAAAGLEIAAAMAVAARLEVAGALRREGGLVLPGR